MKLKRKNEKKLKDENSSFNLQVLLNLGWLATPPPPNRNTNY